MVRSSLVPIVRGLIGLGTILEADCYAGVLDAVRQRPDLSLIIMDLDLPDMPSFDGVGAVRAEFGGKVVVMSGSHDCQMVHDVLKKGVAGFVPKTMGMDAIRAAIGIVLAGETFVPSTVFFAATQPGRTASHETSEPRLTDRERQVIALVSDGLSNKAIARELRVSEVTVKTHLGKAFQKIGAQNRVQASRWALVHGAGSKTGAAFG